MAPVCGLLKAETNAQIPLQDIKLHADITGLAAQVRMTLQYKNTEENPVEAVYVLPVDDEASVCGCRAKVGDRCVVAKIEEKKKAWDMYDDAISSGQTAYLMEESEQSSDILKISVGNLPALCSVTVEVDFVLELRVEGKERSVFFFPQVLIPRYTPSSTQSAEPHISTTTPRIAEQEDMPYGFTFTCDIQASNPIKKVESPKQVLSVTVEENAARVSLAKAHDFQHDLQLHILTEEPLKAYAVVEAGKAGSEGNELLANPVVMVNFFPVVLKEKEEDPCEMIFVIDRSGSMGGEPMRAARETLLLCLKSLPANCYFNVIGFGSSYKTLFPSSQEYSDETLEKACTSSEQMEADLGGTELMRPLQWLYNQPCVPGHSRQVFVLTDGAVGNTKQVIDLVAANAKTSRTFSIGIGEGVSTSLVKGMAKAGKGRCEFVSMKDRLQEKVIRLLKCALQPSLTDVTLKWDVGKGYKVKQIPSEVPPLFDGEKLVIYGILEASKKSAKPFEKLEGSVAIEGICSNKQSKKKGLLSPKISFEKSAAQDTSNPSLMLHHLAGKRAIQDMMKEEYPSQENVIKTSKESNVLSPYTAFIAVDEETSAPVDGPLMRRDIASRKIAERCYQDLMLGCSLSAPVCAPRKSLMGKICKKSKAPCKRTSATKAMPPAMMFSMSLARAPPPAMMDSDEEDLYMDCMMPAGLAPESSSHYDDMDELCIEESFSPSPLPSKDALMSVIKQQKAVGNWTLSDQLLTLLGQSRSSLDTHTLSKKLDLSTEQDSKIAATALVLVWLEDKQASKKSEWEIIAEKAKKWLSMNTKDLTVNEVMDMARDFLH